MVEEARKRIRAVHLYLQREFAIGTGQTPVDRRDGDIPFHGKPAEPVTGVDHQRRADDQHSFASFEGRKGFSHSFPGDGLTEEHDIRFEDAAAFIAADHPEVGEIRPFDLGITVRRLRPAPVCENRVQIEQPALEAAAVEPLMTFHTANDGCIAVEFDQIALTRGPVQ